MRELVCEMCFLADSGHPCSSLSLVDILAVLFFGEATLGEKGKEIGDDSIILSKGHGAPALYAAMMVKGWLAPELRDRLRRLDGPLQGHPDVTRLPEVTASTGALGQGLSMAIGHALAMRLKHEEGRYSFCLLGDGENQEGQIWEAALFAGNNQLSHLIGFIDYNKSQSDGPLQAIMPLGDLRQKWESFNWLVVEVDGHDTASLLDVLKTAKLKRDARPVMVIAHTRKGYIGPDYAILDGNHAGKIDGKTLNEVRSFLSKAGK